MLGTSLVGGKGKRSSASSAAPTSRAMVPWEQEVTDEQGRRRFHGAFTGGFSAGYYNTVGSEEGWTPSTFKSSRGGAGGGGAAAPFPKLKRGFLLRFPINREGSSGRGGRPPTTAKRILGGSGGGAPRELVRSVDPPPGRFIRCPRTFH